ncbi:hypothetical protein C4J90_1536 [Pseudomonas sp. R2-60-08W]|nr:hypothetical protein C4J90_1536 [Pseudomonas sp. R2-60-08W]
MPPIAVGQFLHVLTDTPLSGASPLPQGIGGDLKSVLNLLNFVEAIYV